MLSQEYSLLTIVCQILILLRCFNHLMVDANWSVLPKFVGSKFNQPQTGKLLALFLPLSPIYLLKLYGQLFIPVRCFNTRRELVSCIIKFGINLNSEYLVTYN